MDQCNLSLPKSIFQAVNAKGLCDYRWCSDCLHNKITTTKRDASVALWYSDSIRSLFMPWQIIFTNISGRKGTPNSNPPPCLRYKDTKKWWKIFADGQSQSIALTAQGKWTFLKPPCYHHSVQYPLQATSCQHDREILCCMFNVMVVDQWLVTQPLTLSEFQITYCTDRLLTLSSLKA